MTEKRQWFGRRPLRFCEPYRFREGIRGLEPEPETKVVDEDTRERQPAKERPSDGTRRDKA